jgi:hypothetical protein
MSSELELVKQATKPFNNLNKEDYYG